MQRYKILWVDDEIDLLKPYVLTLEEKNFQIDTFNNPYSILEYINENNDFDLILLDENMPGKSGLTLIKDIKDRKPFVPIIMITKNEEENIMNEAIGSMISDYLIKPLNPNQLLISIKKVLQNSELVSEKIKVDYLNFFNNLDNKISNCKSHLDWINLYKEFVFWEINIEESSKNNFDEFLSSQKKELNSKFSNFVINNYEDWITGIETSPIMSHNILSKRVFKHLGSKPIFLIVVDNLRYDQWKIIESDISKIFNVKNDDPYLAILPTTTEYSRNSLFSGLTPLEMSKKHPELWENKSDGLNSKEFDFIDKNLERHSLNIKHSYNKIISHSDGNKLSKKKSDLLKYDLNSIVFNFIDMMSHSSSENMLFKNLAYDEKSFRSFTSSWFKNSPLNELITFLSKQDVKVFLTTDHGTVKVENPIKIKGNKETNTNLRFKVGKNINTDNKDLYIVENGEKIGLPQKNIFTKYLFSVENQYLLFPKDFNYYSKNFLNSFQHGGISLDEMIIPFIELDPKI